MTKSFERPSMAAEFDSNCYTLESENIPGYNTSVTFQCAGNFPHALSISSDNAMPLKTLREFTMLQIMDQITDKTNWTTKVFDEQIVGKWKAELMAVQGRDISEPMFEYLIAELRHRSSEFQKTGRFVVYNGNVVKSDVAVSESLRLELLDSALVLEDVPERLRDWHPGSKEQVLDLVHPSLFPLVYGQTRILPNVGRDDCLSKCGQGEIIPRQTPTPMDPNNGWESRRDASFSHRFQWLPSEVQLTHDADNGNIEAKFTSYINNLHPKKHRSLYSAIEKVLSCAIPLWYSTFKYQSDISLGNLRDRISVQDFAYDPDPNDENFPHHLGPRRSGSDTDDDDHDEDEDRYWEWLSDFKANHIKQPEPGKFDAEAYGKESEKEAVWGPESACQFNNPFREHIQVIVKLANIHLSPDKPRYEGGSWHVEGQLNEHICATALYYYDSENVSPSRLSFKQTVDSDATLDIPYEQGEFAFLPVIFGCDPEGSLSQEVGSVSTHQGRLLTFPNTLQHRVNPFELQDKTKPGHRKILALFLVDPNQKIISTNIVPPQQRDWWAEQVLQAELNNLPTELNQQIIEAVEWPMGLEEAKSIRLELMEERRNYEAANGEAFAGTDFGLCEH